MELTPTVLVSFSLTFSDGSTHSIYVRKEGGEDLIASTALRAGKQEAAHRGLTLRSARRA